MNDRSPALEWIDPPHGGMRALQGRIRRRVRHRFVATASLVMLLAAGTLLQNMLTTAGPDRPVNEMIRQHAANKVTTTDSLRVIDGAALELPNPTSNARIYLVSSAPEQPLSG